MNLQQRKNVREILRIVRGDLAKWQAPAIGHIDILARAVEELDAQVTELQKELQMRRPKWIPAAEGWTMMFIPRPVVIPFEGEWRQTGVVILLAQQQTEGFRWMILASDASGTKVLYDSDTLPTPGEGRLGRPKSLSGAQYHCQDDFEWMMMTL
jgi:hypothetical protein